MKTLPFFEFHKPGDIERKLKAGNILQKREVFGGLESPQFIFY